MVLNLKNLNYPASLPTKTFFHFINGDFPSLNGEFTGLNGEFTG